MALAATPRLRRIQSISLAILVTAGVVNYVVGGYIGGALAPTVTGFIVGGTGHFSMAFITGAVIALVAALGYWTLIQEPIADEIPMGVPVGGLRAAG